MKKINDLKEGKCKVIAENKAGQIKKFEGVYNPKFEIVFCCIPSTYKTLGYEQ